MTANLQYMYAMHLVQVTLSEEQTCTLMSCLEEICLSELSDAASPEVRSISCPIVASGLHSTWSSPTRTCTRCLLWHSSSPSIPTLTFMVPTNSTCSNGHHVTYLHTVLGCHLSAYSVHQHFHKTEFATSVCKRGKDSHG